MNILQALIESQAVSTYAEAKRLIHIGQVKVNNEIVIWEDETVTSGDKITVGSTRPRTFLIT